MRSTETHTFRIPRDGRSFFRLEGQDIPFAEDNQIGVGKLSGGLYLTLRLGGDDFDWENAGIPEDAVTGLAMEVGFRIELKPDLLDGIPTASFHYEYGRSANRGTYMWEDGWNYYLNFTGHITLRDGWLGMNGWMENKYDNHKGRYGLECYLKIPLDELKWQHYRFSSLTETEAFAPETVTRLWHSLPAGLPFPEQILNFPNLKELRLEYADEPTEAGFSLPEDMSRLSRLEEISLNKLPIRSLPESLAHLPALKKLRIHGSPLEALPDAFWQMPSVEYLWLSQNRLRHLPEDIRLPQLKGLNLKDNQFHSLPEVLARQPLLQHIEIAGNPLEALPDTFNDIGIDLSLADKQRLLDYAYKGADGQGLVEWDDSRFYAHNEPGRLDALGQHLREKNYGNYEEALLSLVLKSVRLGHGEEEDYARLGNTRFGGWPDLPPSIPYPRHGEHYQEGKADFAYEFLAQINCAEIAHLQDYLPRTGMLYFFLDDCESLNGRVFYYDGPMDALVSGQHIQMEGEDFNNNSLQAPPYTGYQGRSAAHDSLPDFYADYINTHLFRGLAKALRGQDELLERLSEDLHSLGEDEAVNGVRPSWEHYINAYVFTQHEAPELQAALKYRGNPEDWIVLLKVGSIGDFQWWDAGDLFFVIHKSDLAKHDFSQVYVGLESS